MFIVKKTVFQRTFIGLVYLNLMVGHRCPKIHHVNPKTPVNIKNGVLKVINVALRLS